MVIDLQNQFYIILWSVLFGALLAILYEIFSSLGFLLGIKNTKITRLSARLPKKEVTRIKKAILSAWDFMYFLFITPMCAIFTFGVNNGIVRWYIVIGALIGFLLLKLTCGRIINLLLDTLVTLFKAFIINKAESAVKKIIKNMKRTKKEKPSRKNQTKRVTLICTNSKQG